MHRRNQSIYCISPDTPTIYSSHAAACSNACYADEHHAHIHVAAGEGGASGGVR